MAPRAKSKEAVALILDIGKSMQKQSVNSKSTIFQEAKRCLIKILEQKIFSDSPNEYVLILFGSDETNNGLKQEGSSRYANIFVYDILRRPTFQLLQYIEDIHTTENEANIADGIVVAADTLHRETAGQKFMSSRIVFLTSFGGSFVLDDFNTVIDRSIAQTGYHLIFMCDLKLQKFESSSEFIEEQRKAEQCFQAIRNVTNCYFCSFQEAKEALTYINIKCVDSAAWFANLYLGSLFAIPIVGYIKTTQSKLKTWFASKKDESVVKNEADSDSTANEDVDCKSGSDKISRKTFYYVGDDKKDVSEDDVIRGYAYGSTTVPVTEEDEAAMQYHSERKGFDILFFTAKENIKVHYKCGDKTMIVAVSHNGRDRNGALAFNALVRALHETNCVAIVRYCRHEKFTSQLGYLAPVIDAEKVVLTYIRLPFAEDLRYLNFPVFNKAPKDVPTNEQLSLINDLITCMDLSKAAVDEDGNECEALICEHVNDPNIQIQFQKILSKCLKRYEPEIVDPFVVPTEFDGKEKILLRIKEKFVLKEQVEEKRALSPEVDTSSEIIAKKPKVEETGDADIVFNESQPAKSFNDLIESGRSWNDGCAKLQEVILKLSDNPMGFNDMKILDALAAFRKHAVASGQTQEYNMFLYSFKLKVKGRVLWKSIKERNLVLITKIESESSHISIDEAKTFAT